MAARSKNSFVFLIVIFDQGTKPFPTSNGCVTWIIVEFAGPEDGASGPGIFGDETAS